MSFFGLLKIVDRQHVQKYYEPFTFMRKQTEARKILEEEFDKEFPEHWWCDIAVTKKGRNIAIGGEGDTTKDVDFYIVDLDVRKLKDEYCQQREE